MKVDFNVSLKEIMQEVYPQESSSNEGKTGDNLLESLVNTIKEKHKRNKNFKIN